MAIVGIGAAVYLMKMRAKKVEQSPQTAVPVSQAVELAPVEVTQVTQLDPSFPPEGDLARDRVGAP